MCFCAEADTWLTLSPDHEEEWTQTLSGLAREGKATPVALAALFSALVLCVLFLRRFLTSKVSLKYFDFFLFLGRPGCVMRGRVGVTEAGSSTEAADADDKLITAAAFAAVVGCDSDVDAAATGSSASGHCDSAAAAPAVDATGVAVAAGSEAPAEASIVHVAAASGCSQALAVPA